MCVHVNHIGYAPIRFKGYTKVNLNLGYSFFYDVRVSPARDGGGVRTGAGNGGGDQNPAPERRRRGGRRGRREVGEAEQVVKISFRMVRLRSGILLYSQTSLSSHLIRVSICEHSYRLLSWKSAHCPVDHSESSPLQQGDR